MKKKFQAKNIPRPETPQMPDELREKIDMQYQVNDQLRLVRYAWAEGDLMALGRTVSTFASMLWPWFPQQRKAEYNEIKFEPLGKSDVLSTKDKKHMQLYAELNHRREKELARELASRNRPLFYKFCGKRLHLVMETVKQMNLGFETASKEEI